MMFFPYNGVCFVGARDTLIRCFRTSLGSGVRSDALSFLSRLIHAFPITTWIDGGARTSTSGFSFDTGLMRCYRS